MGGKGGLMGKLIVSFFNGCDPTATDGTIPYQVVF